MISRSKSPFYKHNHNSEDEYKKFQRRDKSFFETNEKWDFYCKRQSYTNSLKYYIEKYGDKEGREKWNNYNKSKDSSSSEHFIKKYDNLAYIKYDEKCKSCDSSSKKYYLKKYGKIEGNTKWEYIHSKEYYIEKYGYQNGNRIFNIIQLKKK